MKKLKLLLLVVIFGCTSNVESVPEDSTKSLPAPDHKLTSDQTHNKFSRTIEPVLKINSGEVVEISTEEATDGQLEMGSDVEDLMSLSFDPIHPLTGPIHINDSQPFSIAA